MLTSAELLVTFVHGVNLAKAERSAPLVQWVAYAMRAEFSTREFQVALDGIRENCTRTKRWVDSHPVLESRERVGAAVQKIRFTLEPGQLMRPYSSHAEVYGDGTLQALAKIDAAQRAESAFLRFPSTPHLREALYTLRFYIADIESEVLRDHVLVLLATLEYALNNIETIGPHTIVSQTSALLGAIIPAAPKQPEKRNRIMGAVAAIGVIHLGLTGLNGTYTELKALFSNASEAAKFIADLPENLQFLPDSLRIDMDEYFQIETPSKAIGALPSPTGKPNTP